MRAPVLALAASIVATNAAFGGGFSFPCTPGNFSPTGFTPCTPCPAGTYTAGLGFGETSCAPCGCNDLTACTLDTCNANNGQCSAEAVPSCQVERVDFSGVVTSTEPGLVPVEIGMPFDGHYLVDPLAPDADPLDASQGDYLAATHFEARIGAGPPVLEVHAKIGRIAILDDDDGNEDIYALLVDAPDIDVPPEFDNADYVAINLTGGSVDTFASDALPPGAPDLAAFAEPHIEFALGGLAVAGSNVFSMEAPEPGPEIAPAVALAALLGFAVRRRGGVRRA